MIAAVSVIEAIYRAARPWQAGANGDTNSRAGGPPPPSAIACGHLPLENVRSASNRGFPGNHQVGQQ